MMRVSRNGLVSDGALRLPGCGAVVIIGAMVLAVSACQRSTPVVRVRGDAGAGAPDGQPGATALPAEISVRVVEIKSWEMAPPACRLPLTRAPVRSETRSATM